MAETPEQKSPDSQPPDSESPGESLFATLRANVGDAVDKLSPEVTVSPISKVARNLVNQSTVQIPNLATEATILQSPATAGVLPAVPRGNTATILKAASTFHDKPRFRHNTDSLSRGTEYTVHTMVGKGGMGQVFRAAQNALRREVAIKKIIPEHLEGDSAFVLEQAFVSEALVTGFLDHPNIVPVYTLGRDKEGKWFFTMKMVRGIEWRHLLHPDRCKDPEMREKARAAGMDVDDPARRLAHIDANLRVLQAVCNGVAFAHSKKIIHRDLKPENVMVGAFGEVLVMDWGLAVDVSDTPLPPGHIDRRVPTRDECGLGGTPAYMAPEQCAVNDKHLYVGDNLNCWTDVFQLGAILCEVLSGGPPFGGGSLRHICDLVAACVPPNFSDTVPHELADICRKAMAKDPRDRYPDALAFQDALQDYIAHHQSAAIAAKADREAVGGDIPSLARAAVLYDQALELWPKNSNYVESSRKVHFDLSVKERNVRWTRWAARSLAAMVFLGVTIAFFWIRAEKNQVTDALKVSARRGDLLTAALDRQINDIQDEFENRPGLQNIKKKLLISAVDGYKQASELMANTQTAERQTAVAFNKLGEIYLELGDTVSAANVIGKAFEITRKLADADPSSAQAQRDLANSFEKLGDVSLPKGDAEGARSAYQKALDIRQKLASADPSSSDLQRELAASLSAVGKMCVKLGDNTAALTVQRRGLAIREKLAKESPSNEQIQYELSQSYVMVGYISNEKLGDTATAAEAYRKALAIGEKLNTRNSDAQRGLAVSHLVLGKLNIQMGDVSAGLDEYRKSLAILDKLAESDPMSATTQRYRSFAFTNVGDATALMGGAEAALGYYRQALEVREKLASTDPRNTEIQRFLSMSYINIGDMNTKMGDAEAGRAEYKKALSIRESLAGADEKNVQLQEDLAEAYVKTGDASVQMGDIMAGLEAYQKSLCIREARASDPANVKAQRDLALSYEKLGDADMQIGEAAAARSVYETARDIRVKLAASNPKNASFQRDLAQSNEDMGDVLAQMGEAAAAREEYKKSYEIRAMRAAADPKNTEAQSDLAQSIEKIGALDLKQGAEANGLVNYQRALEIRKKLAAEDPLNLAAQSSLAKTHVYLGYLHLLMGNQKEALDEYMHSIAIREKRAAAEPHNAEVQRDLVISHNTLGIALAQSGEIKQALISHRKALGIAEKLVLEDPLSVLTQKYLAFTYTNIGDADIRLGDAGAAYAVYQKALAIRVRQAAADAKNLEAQRSLGVIYDKIGLASTEMGDADVALAAYQKSVEIRQTLSQADPGNIRAQREFSEALLGVGAVLADQMGKLDAGLTAYGTALSIRQKLADAAPKNAKAQSDLAAVFSAYARSLLITKEESRRNASQALDYARKAAALEKKPDERHFDTLALALFRNGLKAEAIDAQKKALAQLSKDVLPAKRAGFEQRLKEYENGK